MSFCIKYPFAHPRIDIVDYLMSIPFVQEFFILIFKIYLKKLKRMSQLKINNHLTRLSFQLKFMK